MSNIDDTFEFLKRKAPVRTSTIRTALPHSRNHCKSYQHRVQVKMLYLYGAGVVGVQLNYNMSTAMQGPGTQARVEGSAVKQAIQELEMLIFVTGKTHLMKMSTCRGALRRGRGWSRREDLHFIDFQRAKAGLP